MCTLARGRRVDGRLLPLGRERASCERRSRGVTHRCQDIQKSLHPIGIRPDCNARVANVKPKYLNVCDNQVGFAGFVVEAGTE